MTHDQCQTHSKQRSITTIMENLIPILIITTRILLANKTPILDCDEVYNYWEGLHSLLYNNETYLQTWEYAPQFALRSYTYLYPFYTCAKVLHYFTENKVWVFYCLRSIQAGITGYCEVSYALSENNKDNNVGYLYLCFSIVSSGMYHSSVSFLPSSTVMQLYLLSQSHLHLQNVYKCIFYGIICVLCTAWPFCSVLFLPCGLYILFTERRNVINIISYAVIVTSLVQIITTCIDTHHYNTPKYIFSTWNILKYNIQGGGDELYGVEPLSFYIKNLLLNFNYASFIGILLTPIILMLRKKWGIFYKVLLPMYLWIGITFTRNHKEERFLYPIYPLILYSCALGINEFVGYLHLKTLRRKWLCFAMILFPYTIISLSRNMALSTYYMAPIHTFDYFYQHTNKTPSKVCIGGEWYRYPSSFFLPPNVQLGYLKSSFGGQLPKPIYGDDLTQKSTFFNGLNQEESSRYVEMEECDYIVDLRFENEEKNMLRILEEDWKEVVEFPFLDGEKTSVLHRSLYLPFLDGRRFAKYVLFERQ